MNKDRSRGQHPAAGAGESCTIYYNVKASLEVHADRKASMPDYQNVEKKIAAIPRV